MIANDLQIKLTAYALGELDEKERASTETLLGENEEARKFVAEVRSIGAELTTALQSEESPGLSPAQEQEIFRRARARQEKKGWLAALPAWNWGWGVGVAAALVLLGSMLAFPLMRGGVVPQQTESIATSSEVSENSVADEKVLAANECKTEIIKEIKSDAVCASTPVCADQYLSGYASHRGDQSKQITLAKKEKMAMRMRAEGGAMLDESVCRRGEDVSHFVAGAKRQRALNTPADSGVMCLGFMACSPAVPNSRESYQSIQENPFCAVKDEPLSTFSIDVDTASYSNVRRYLECGSKPPADAVRIEELINYFSYQYDKTEGDEPFSVNMEVAPAPWNPEHYLARIGLKGREVSVQNRPAANLVFLVDVSGSMDHPNKLPLVKESLLKLLESLKKEDRVAIVVYAGASGMVLPSTEVTHSNKAKIAEAIQNLTPGGSTNGEAGIQLAYDIAKANLIESGVNRVILATDGDFNVGVSDDGGLVRLVEEKAKSKIFLTVLGYGTGNLNDSMMEQISGRGNGNYAYIDSMKEAKKALGSQVMGTLVTIAKDVKIQVEFNPAHVAGHRLIGYENRILAARDFNNDKKDAGEIGSGHAVTALYELVPVGKKLDVASVDELRYQQEKKPTSPSATDKVAWNDELMLVKLRHKKPDGDVSSLTTKAVKTSEIKKQLGGDMSFVSGVAQFGMLLRNSEYKGKATWDNTLDLVENGLKNDPEGWRKEFLELVRKAKKIDQ